MHSVSACCIYLYCMLNADVIRIYHLCHMMCADTSEADALAQTVDEACALLASYNSRLADELVERKRVAKMLRSYIISQKNALTESETKLQEYRSRLEKVDAIHKELKSHVQSLPDLTLLPDVTGGLKPLPSAGDLFSSGEQTD